MAHIQAENDIENVRMRITDEEAIIENERYKKEIYKVTIKSRYNSWLL